MPGLGVFQSNIFQGNVFDVWHLPPKIQTIPRTWDKYVRRPGGDYAQQFLRLLPQGQAWPKTPGSVLYNACLGLANYWGYVDQRAGDLLLVESDPRTTHELLSDWERNWGLPDPCWASPTTEDDRRKVLVQWMTMLGGQSRDFFYSVAKFLGHSIHIMEHAPWMFGISEFGQTDDGEGGPKWEIGQPEIRFYWTIQVSNIPYDWWQFGVHHFGVEHHLIIDIPPNLDCIYRRWKPAQTELIMDYSQGGTTFAASELQSQPGDNPDIGNLPPVDSPGYPPTQGPMPITA